MTDPESNQLPYYPLKCYSAFQWKYDIDKNSSWWKRFYFRHVWLPFARFSYNRMHIIPFERLEPDGSLSWKERQGVFLNEADAAREAAKHAFGGYSEVLLNASEPRATIIGRTHFPASDVFTKYEETIDKEQAHASRQVRQVLDQAQRVIDLFRSTRP